MVVSLHPNYTFVHFSACTFISPYLYLFSRRRKLVLIRCNKGAGTKMHKCIVRMKATSHIKYI